MVLSNKKLKQKLRAALAETALGNLSQQETKKRKRDGNEENSTNLLSATDALGVSLKLPRLSKREKRRQKLLLSSNTHKDIGQKPASESNAAEEDKNPSAANGKEEEKKKKKEKKTDEREQGTDKTEKNDAKNKSKKKKEKKTDEQEQGTDKTEKNDAKNKSKKKKKEKFRKKNKKKEEQREKGTEVSDFQLDKTNESEEKVNVSTKIYVGGIPYYSTEDDIRSFFDGCGTITEIDCLTFPESGKFRGIAMITFRTEAAAKRALALDGADMGGLFLSIQPYRATTRTEKSDFAPKRMDGYNRIYMGNLSWDVTEEDIRNLFSECKIKALRFGMNKDTDEFLGYGHVDFEDDASLAKALTLDQHLIHERPVKIRCAVPKKGVENKMPDSESVPNKSKKRRTCYTCGTPGHLSSSCPQKQQPDKKMSSDSRK